MIFQKLWPKIDNLSIKSQLKTPQTGEYRQEGSFNNNKLTLIANPVKYDLILSSENNFLTSEPYGILTIGTFKESISEFVKIAKKWLSNENISPINRIGFGVDLFYRVKTIEEGYNTISKFLPFKIDPKTSTDFRLQINKFVQSNTIKQVRINRLTSWGALRLQSGLTNVVNPNIQISYPDVYYDHVNLDINTAQESIDVFEGSKTLSFFDELTSQAIKISEEGIINI